MSPPPARFFRIPLKLNSQGSRSEVMDQARRRIFEKLNVRGNNLPISNTGNQFDVIERFNERLLTIISKCEEFAVGGKITLIVSLNGPYTLKNAKSNILNSLFIECEEARLAAALQEIIHDLKESKRRADIIAQVAKERKAIEDALIVILWRLSRSDYCGIIPKFNKSSCAFEFDFIDRGETDFFQPLKEEEFLWDPDTQKNEIRGYLHSNLNSGFPWIIYYYKWHIYRDDPEDFDYAEIEFQNLLDDGDVSESDTNLGQRLINERREAYQRAIREAGGALSFAATFFFDHVVNKVLYSIPVVGTAMMVYDLAQLASELPDDVRVFSKIILDEGEI